MPGAFSSTGGVTAGVFTSRRNGNFSEPSELSAPCRQRFEEKSWSIRSKSSGCSQSYDPWWSEELLEPFKERHLSSVSSSVAICSCPASAAFTPVDCFRRSHWGGRRHCKQSEL